MDEDSLDEKEYKKFKILNEINESEIDRVLSSYELASDISLFPSALGIGGGSLAILGGAGIYGMAALASYFGFGTFAAASTFGICTGGIGFALVGVGAGFAFLMNHFDNKKREKSYDKSIIKTFEEKLNDPNSTEREFYNIFIENLYKYFNDKITTLIKFEHDQLIKVANELELDSQDNINIIAKQLVKKVKDRLLNFHELDKFSILVLGKSGVGKTTLINAILDQDQKGTTIGLPMTMENPQMKHTNRNLFPALDIWDSRGLELNKDFSIENSSNQVINFIKNGLKREENNDKSKNYIHCIWYCITGTRIERAELEYIKKLKNIYSSDKQLPIIFVYTQAINEEYTKEIKNVIIEELNDPNIKYIEVISKPIQIKIKKKTTALEKTGLRKLMRQSIELAKNGFESAFFGNILKQFDNLISYYLVNKPNLGCFKNVQEQINSKIKEGTYSTKIFEQYPDTLYDSLKHLYLDDATYEISKDKNKVLLEPLKELFKNWYKQKFTEFSDIITENELKKFIEIPLKNYYDEAFKKEISKISDYEFLSKFHKDCHKERIKKDLDPQRELLNKNINDTIQNYIQHKKALGTYFVIEYLTKEFLEAIKERTSIKIENAKKIIKNNIDKEVQDTAREIYSNLAKGININLIPESEDDDEQNETNGENGIQNENK